MKNLLALIFVTFSISSCNATQYTSKMKSDDRSYIRVFGGEIYLPSPIVLEASSIQEYQVNLNNIYEAPFNEEINNKVVITVGMRSENFLENMSKDTILANCYGFQQAFNVIESSAGQLQMVTFFDENVFVTFLTDKADPWWQSLSSFMAASNDLNGKCLKESLKKNTYYSEHLGGGNNK